MSTRRVRVPERLLTFIVYSEEWSHWCDGAGVLPTDAALFGVIRAAVPEARADGSIRVDANEGIAASLHQWALRLTYEDGSSEDDRRANVRSARSVIRQIDPRAFV